jgi:hypothetical protein
MPEISYARGMTGYLNSRGIGIFDYPKFAEPYREAIREKTDTAVISMTIIAAEMRKAIIFLLTLQKKLVKDVIKYRVFIVISICSFLNQFVCDQSRLAIRRSSFVAFLGNRNVIWYGRFGF